MSDNSKNENQPRMATLGEITRPPNAPSRSLTKMAVILLLVIVALFLVLQDKQDKLDVYKTISELEFADAALERCVNLTAEVNGWTDVGHFLSLRCNSPSADGIRRLDGIEHLVELTDVNLAFNRITDVAPLAHLPRIAVVDLSHNMITRLPVLKSAPNLKRIELNYNLLGSLEWLTAQHFPVLDSLSVAHNQISDVTAIPTLKGVTELNVRNNQIANLEPILQLTALVMLDAGGNLIDDLSDIGMLSELRQLFLDSNKLSSLEGLENIPALEEVDLSNNALQSTSQISQLFRLQRLNLDQTGISSLSDVLALGDLEVLQVSGNPDLGCESISQAIREYGIAAIKSDKVCPLLKDK
jgi:Leucine-rich repeat (LRR) protein